MSFKKNERLLRSFGDGKIKEYFIYVMYIN